MNNVTSPGEVCVWTPMDASGIEMSSSSVVVTPDNDNGLSLKLNSKTIWYTLRCNRTEGGDDDDDDTDSSSIIALTGALKLFVAFVLFAFFL